MSVEQRRAGHPLPNKATGLRGVQDLFVGRGEYVHPVLRWTARPLLALAWIGTLTAEILGEYPSTALPVLFVALFIVSLASSATNMLLLRRRRCNG
jgi:hypothetical protein